LDSFPPEVHSCLIRLPDELPNRVQEITGIAPEDFAQAEEAAFVWNEFDDAARSGELDSFAVAHYAQFERGFLKQFYADHGGEEKFPLPDFCTYRIAKRLFAEAPSGNIRGLAGYLGFELNEIKRAADHVLATTVIWQRIASELHKIGVGDRSALEVWLKAKAPGKSVSTNFRVDRLKRLKLPKGPGIYRMLAKNKEILYVGKATSLHSRVNSYFRGGCVGDRRKLEMLARVWDVEVEECGSPLEAALRENEEIKRLSPHYNRALNSGPRPLVYFSRDFKLVSFAQSAEHPFGPFREKSSVQQLADFILGICTEIYSPIFYDSFPEDVLKDGVKLFCAEEKLGSKWSPTMRELLALGLKFSRREAVDEEEEELPEAEQVVGKIRRMLIRGAEEYRRSKRLGKLVNAEVSWELEDGNWRSLTVANGKINTVEHVAPKDFPWAGLESDDYDRISVLYSELRKRNHRLNSAYR
ncbi:MAG: GIY-YIG nuclease family protein, partial [Bdellovibrionota bacterium]